MKAIGILLLASIAVCTSATLQCLGDDGSPVDWWVAIKYPNPQGRLYAYTDSNNSTNDLKLSMGRFETGYASGLNYTLTQIYGQPANSLSFVLFNDDPPKPDAKRSVEEAEATQKAHAKGVVAVDNQGNGFWLLHSVPKFPMSPLDTTTFEYMDDSQVKYAQSLLCVSFSGWSTFNNIGYQLQVYKPQFYPSSLSTTMQANAPNLYDAAEFGKYENSAMTSVKELKTKRGMNIKSFAKTGYYGDGWDMYDELLAPTLADSMYVETWRQGSGGPLPSNCTTQYEVMNIDYMDLDGVAWKYTADHSKWGITESKTWVCICGINRMASQGKRGGGGLCFENSQLHASMDKSITQLAQCPV